MMTITCDGDDDEVQVTRDGDIGWDDDADV